MGKFKIGDRVRCIDDSDTDCVKRGEEYDVMGVHEPYIDVLADGEPHGMYAYRFELIPALTIEPGRHYRTRSGKPTGRVTVGDTGFEAVVDGKVQIYDAAGGHVHGDADLDIVEEWVPRVGERVVEAEPKQYDFVAHWRDFWQGAEGPIVDDAFVVTKVSGNFVHYSNRVGGNGPQATLDCFEPLPVAAPAQPAAALKIEAGRYYKTRDGRKVGPMRRDRGFWNSDGGANGTPGHFTDSGISALAGRLPREPGREVHDLIAEWVDEPVVVTPSAPIAAQVDTIAEEYGPPPAEPDTTLHIKFTSDFSELDAAILVRKKKLKKLIKLARKAGIELREAA